MSESLLDRGSVDLSAYEGVATPDYRLEGFGDRILYVYPPGTSFLSLPFIAACHVLGVRVAPDRQYSFAQEASLQGVLAALVTAATVAWIFAMARLRLSRGPALAVSACAAWSTSLWSTSSRALWSDTYGTLFSTAVAYAVLANALGRCEIRAIVMATLLAWLYFIKPSYATTILATSAYVALALDRRTLIRFAAVGLGWAAAFVAYFAGTTGDLLPRYYRQSLGFSPEGFGGRLLGVLVSPSRGLFVYSPLFACILGLALLHLRRIAARRAAVLALVVIAAQVLVTAGWAVWWGGHSYGPRLLTPTVPWFALLGALVLSDMRSSAAHARPLVVLGVTATLGVFMHGAGALSSEGFLWNVRPGGSEATRLWDFHDPPFFRFLHTPAPGPNEFPVYEGGRLNLGLPETDRFAWAGFSYGETQFRWTQSTRAVLIFGVTDGARPRRLIVKLRPFRRQRLRLSLNGVGLGEWSLDRGRDQTVIVDVPANALAEHNLLTFDVPDARRRSWFGKDRRALGVRVYWFELVDVPVTTRGRTAAARRVLAGGAMEEQTRAAMRRQTAYIDEQRRVASTVVPLTRAT